MHPDACGCFWIHCKNEGSEVLHKGWLGSSCFRELRSNCNFTFVYVFRLFISLWKANFIFCLFGTSLFSQNQFYSIYQFSYSFPNSLSFPFIYVTVFIIDSLSIHLPSVYIIISSVYYCTLEYYLVYFE